MLQYNQKEIESEILKFWEEKKIPERLAEQRKNAKPFFLLDGPPYANAQPHVGHVKTTACKDIWSRYKQMQGFRSYFQAGFDCHGLPTEVMVEKELGIESKRDIEKLGIEKFDAKCLEKVLNTEKGWMEYYRLLGAWRYYNEPYFTYKDSYIESGWWTLKQMHEKGLLYEGEKPVYWCPHCETSLSGYEVSDSYKDVQDPSVFVKFKLKGKENEFLLVWTTTPWTLPANVTVVVHPDETYLRAKVGNEIFIIAEKRAEPILKEKLGLQYEIAGKIKGKELDGLEYEPLLDVQQQRELGKNARKVHLSIPILTNKKYKKKMLKEEKKSEEKAVANITGTAEKEVAKATGTEEKEEFEEFVTMTDGTGLVHCAPGHGQTDYYLGKHYSLPTVSPVDEHGKFTEKVDGFSGMFVKSADKHIVEKLESENKLLHSEKIMHRSALCWRCKSPLIFRLSPQWYLSVEPIKEKMISENEKSVSWFPDYGKTKFHNWIVDREDWCVSQQRYWGIPLPIWICEKCKKFEVIGSKKELAEKSLQKISESQLNDLHRHTVDKIELKCSSCGGTSKRVKDILNVWFDSGIAPWASLGYPFKNKELFEQMFPVDLINESQDQIRGWFDSLMFAGVATFGKTPYKAVGLMGWVLDEKGDKMSKSQGNVVYAKDAIEKLSADVIRMYYCYEIAPWEVQKFSFRTAEEVKRAYSILFNSFAFYKTYSEGVEVADDAANGKKLKTENLKTEDRWILSRLNSTISSVTTHLDNFEFHLAGRTLLNFLMNDFSRGYIKLIRDRVSTSESGDDKKICLSVMRKCLFEYCKLLAPISPFLSEYLYRELKDASSPESVHFCDYPKADKKAIDAKLEEQFRLVSEMVESINSARQEAGLKLRWPLDEIFISGNEKTKDAVSSLNSILSSSANCQKMTFSEKEPADKNSVAKEFSEGKVFVPKSLSENAKLNAAFRELVRAIQDARKKNGFVVQERIKLEVFSENGKLMEHLKNNSENLKSEVGASSVKIIDAEAKLGGNVKAEVALPEFKISISAQFSKA